MNKKLKFWILNIILTVITSLLFNGVDFEDSKRDVLSSTRGIGTLKLSDKNFIRPEESNIAMLTYPSGKQIAGTSRKNP